MQAEAGPQYGLTNQEQQQEYGDINASTNAAVNQDSKQIADANESWLTQTAAGDIYTAGDSPLTNNLELSSTVPLQPISVGPIGTPSLAAIGQEITTGLQQGALPGGADQWNTFFDPTAGQQVAQNFSTGQSLIWDSSNEAWVAPLPEVVISATREPTAQQYEADQQQLANQSNALAAEVFGSFGPYALAKGIYNGAVGATADAAYIGARLFGASTQTADAWASYIDRAQVSPGALEQAMGQSASPYLQSGYQGLASVVGSANADDLSHLAGLGLNSLAILPAAEPLSTVGSSLREGIGQLGGDLNLQSPIVPVGVGEMGMFGIKAIQSPFVSPASELPVVTFSASKYPGLADNILNAQQAGYPDVLTYGGDAAANRAAALESVPNIPPLSRDEYPFASTLEGGGGSWVGHIPVSEQNAQGAILKNFYKANNIQPGDQFRVIVGN